MNMKKIIIVMLLLFLCGMIAGDWIVGNLKQDEVILGLDVYKEYAYSKPVFEDVFWQIFLERCKCLLFVLILLMTPLKKIMPLILVGGATFMMGFFTMSNLVSLGGVGFLIAIATFLPQVVFYGGMMAVLSRGKETYTYHKGRKMASHTLSIILSAILFLAGCIVECLMGVHFIPWIIRLSLI